MISPWITNTFVDSCAFDPKCNPEDTAATEIFRLHREQNLQLVVAHSTLKEIEHPNTPQWVKQEAGSKICSIGVQLTPPELGLKRKLLALLAGNGKPEKMAQDAEHIFEAQKYGSYFVTTDQRLLSRAVDVAAICSVTVLLPSEFLSLVLSHAKST